jgi:hypothetical protein
MSATQVCQWSLQHSWHLADPVCWQTQGGLHRAAHPTNRSFWLWTHQLIETNQCWGTEIKFKWLHTIPNVATSFHSSHTIMDSPHPTYGGAHLLPPQPDLYHCYPPQRLALECSESSVATMAESVTIHDNNISTLSMHIIYTFKMLSVWTFTILWMVTVTYAHKQLHTLHIALQTQTGLWKKKMVLLNGNLNVWMQKQKVFATDQRESCVWAVTRKV